ncbi:MAG TPA: hypothetical protein VK026_02100 [Paenalcaligenes sp.]|nr:hypothetical protein [Paenalcaligenes sp.]
MSNEYISLASVGNVPSARAAQSSGLGIYAKKLVKGLKAAIRKIDNVAQEYFHAAAEARSRKPAVVCVCDQQRSY